MWRCAALIPSSILSWMQQSFSRRTSCLSKTAARSRRCWRFRATESNLRTMQYSPDSVMGRKPETRTNRPQSPFGPCVFQISNAKKRAWCGGDVLPIRVAVPGLPIANISSVWHAYALIRLHVPHTHAQPHLTGKKGEWACMRDEFDTHQSVGCTTAHSTVLHVDAPP